MTKIKNQRLKVKIVNKNHPILRKVALNVPLADIKSKKIQNIIKGMKATLKKEEDGVAIAAPQIGKSLRIFVVSGKVLAEENSAEIPNDLVFINPEIIKLSRKKKEMEEGCLSVRWLYGRVRRSEKATIQAYDEEDKRFQIGASGLMAQIFQHEVDHFNGILFTDKATNIENLPQNKDKASYGASLSKNKE